MIPFIMIAVGGTVGLIVGAWWGMSARGILGLLLGGFSGMMAGGIGACILNLAIAGALGLVLGGLPPRGERRRVARSFISEHADLVAHVAKDTAPQKFIEKQIEIIFRRSCEKHGWSKDSLRLPFVEEAANELARESSDPSYRELLEALMDHIRREMYMASKPLVGAGFDREKEKKFREFDTPPCDDPEIREMRADMKANWLTSRGICLGKHGRLDAAIRDFEEAISLKKDHLPAYTGLATAYGQQGMFGKALSILQEALSLAEASASDIDEFQAAYGKTEIRWLLVATYLNMGDRENALKHARKALKTLKDPRRREMMENAKRDGVLQPGEDYDQERFETLQGLIRELEEGHPIPRPKARARPATQRKKPQRKNLRGG